MLDFEELGVHLVENNHQALSKQLPPFFRQLEGKIRRSLRCSTDYARDLIHDAFSKSFLKLVQGEIHPTAYHQYLYVASINTAFNRPERDYVALEDAEPLYVEPEVFEPDPAKHPYHEYLAEAVAKLGDESREIIEFILKYPHLTNDDIAASFDLSYSNARVRKYRALKSLREQILELHKPKVEAEKKSKQKREDDEIILELVKLWYSYTKGQVSKSLLEHQTTQLKNEITKR